MKTCESKGCEMKHYALGYCRKHHARFIRNGTDKSKYDRSVYVDLRGVKDTGKGRRGYLAVNVVNDIKYKALKSGRKWSLDHQQAFNLITSECSYCGLKPDWPKRRIGIDRRNNHGHYTIENCVPCCFSCNSAKGRKTLGEFKEWIIKLYNKSIKLT